MANKRAKSHKTQKPHHFGHRDRLRERFRRGGKDAVQDYELLELILFRAIPRRDVKPLAKALLARFGDLSAVLCAPEAQLMEMSGISQNTVVEFRIIQTTASVIGQNRIIGRKAVSVWSDLINYCRSNMADKQTEEFRVLFLDKKNQIIADECMGKGTVDHTPVYPREVIKRSLELNASALIIAHNHPSGDPSPSKADIEMTRKIKDLAAGFNIVLHDHLIIGRSAEVSLKSLDLL